MTNRRQFIGGAAAAAAVAVVPVAAVAQQSYVTDLATAADEMVAWAYERKAEFALTGRVTNYCDAMNFLEGKVHEILKSHGLYRPPEQMEMISFEDGVEVRKPMKGWMHDPNIGGHMHTFGMGTDGFHFNINSTPFDDDTYVFVRFRWRGPDDKPCCTYDMRAYG